MSTEKTLTLKTPLSIDEIDFRVQSVNKGGYVTILAYKDARVDMKRLDDVYGVDKWQKKYEVINNNLFCSVGIWSDTLKEWVWKQDVGTESMTEKTKGQASDAFKRACFNFGIGIELYDYPIIQFQLNDTEFDKATQKASWGFKLKEWKWASQFTDGKLTFLYAKDNHDKQRFIFGKFNKEQ